MTILETPAIDSEVEEVAKQKIRTLAQTFLGDFVERVAVLGAFDTWPYIDHISRKLALNNHVAVTSRYLYRLINGKVLRMRTQEHPGFAPQFHFMGALLDQIISDCSAVIINFSVSAGHFIEIDWCYKKSKKTLGVAYVRATSGLEQGSCENLRVIETDDGFYSMCQIDSADGHTVWECMKKTSYCPFISQDISKNVIEYFFRGRDMEMVAIENIEVLSSILNTKHPVSNIPSIEMKKLGFDIMKDDETIFTRDCIYFILMLDKLSKSSYVNRLSPIKKMAILQKTQGWSDSISSNLNRLRYFVSKHLRDEEPFKSLKEGFVDIDNIGINFRDLALFLKDKEYVELKKIEGVNGLEGFLVKMKTKAKKLVKFYRSL